MSMQLWDKIKYFREVSYPWLQEYNLEKEIIIDSKLLLEFANKNIEQFDEFLENNN